MKSGQVRLAPGQGWVLLPDFRKMLGVRPTIFLSGSPLINYIYKPINKYIYIHIHIHIRTSLLEACLVHALGFPCCYTLLYRLHEGHEANSWCKNSATHEKLQAATNGHDSKLPGSSRANRLPSFCLVICPDHASKHTKRCGMPDHFPTEPLFSTFVLHSLCSGSLG